MPPTSDGDDIRTVGCSLERLIPDATHLQKIRDAVTATHRATILASELLNIHMRRLLQEDPLCDLSCFFDSNWLLNAYNEVTVGKEYKVLTKEAETALCGYNSRSSDLATFCAYCSKRHEGMESCLAFYAATRHRKRRWKRKPTEIRQR